VDFDEAALQAKWQFKAASTSMFINTWNAQQAGGR
jgi:hypothetical protein